MSTPAGRLPPPTGLLNPWAAATAGAVTRTDAAEVALRAEPYAGISPQDWAAALLGGATAASARAG